MHHPARAGGQRRGDEAAVGDHHDHRRGDRAQLGQPRQRAGPVGAEIDQDHLGVGGRHHRHLGHRRQQPLHAGAHQRIVGGDRDPDGTDLGGRER
jgi:hypothetical protein